MILMKNVRPREQLYEKLSCEKNDVIPKYLYACETGERSKIIFIDCINTLSSKHWDRTQRIVVSQERFSWILNKYLYK